MPNILKAYEDYFKWKQWKKYMKLQKIIQYDDKTSRDILLAINKNIDLFKSFLWKYETFFIDNIYIL